MFLNIAQRRQLKTKQTDIARLSLSLYLFLLPLCHFLLAHFTPNHLSNLSISLEIFPTHSFIFSLFSSLTHRWNAYFCQFLTLSSISHLILAAIYYFSRDRQPYIYTHQKGMNIRFRVSNCAYNLTKRADN